jgi:predicted NBD/HSP70 family sugar kinase
MMKKATRQQTRNHNTRLVLKTIYDQRNISRADIARLTHLTRPTVSTIVTNLMAENLVLETGLGPSAGGKPPMLLDIDVDAYRLLCIDLGNQEFRGALLNLQGEMSARIHHPAGDYKGDEALSLVYQLVDELAAATPATLLGISIGTPGLINPDEGLIRRAVNLGWHDLPLGDLLASRFDLPIYVANDSHLAAFGEYTFGEPRDSSNLIVIKIGRGIGAGIVLGGKLFYGDGFSAGEIGHLVVADNSIRCRCGNVGCLETVTSTRAILKAAQAAANAMPASLLATKTMPDWQTLTTALAAGDEAACQVVITAGQYLGMVIASLVGFFNIHHVILTGRIDQLGEPFLEAARTSAMQYALPSMVENTTIQFSNLGTDIVILGGSALVLQQELGII